MIWFTSDWHLFHKNCIKFDNRPFDDVHEMNREIVNRYNKVVGDCDTVYYLGDLTFGGIGATKKLLYELKGKIVYIMGNHDKPKIIQKFSDRFESIHDYLALKKEGIVMFHYPILSWEGVHHGSIHLHGHCHNNLQPIYNHKGQMITRKCLDVGVPRHDYYPISLSDVYKQLYDITNIPTDMHDGEK